MLKSKVATVPWTLLSQIRIAWANPNRMGSRIIGLVPSWGKSHDFPLFDQAASVWVPSAMPAGYFTCPEYKANATKVQHPHPSTPWRLPMSSQPPLCSHMECAPLRRKLFNQDCHVGFYTGFYRAVPFTPHCCIYNLSSKRQLCDCSIIDVTCCYMFEMRGPDWMKGTRRRDKRQS